MKYDRVLLTGGAGFLGRHVARVFAGRHWPVVEIGATGQVSGQRQVVHVPRRRAYDLVDPVAARRLLADTCPDLVIHMAALTGGIGANRERPADFFHDNLMMGVNTLHAAWKAGVQKFVAIGTVCSYPKHTLPPFREEDLWLGYPEETNAPYGLAKKMLLVQAQAYRQQHGFNAIHLLPTNLYGPGDNFDEQTSHVIPAIIRRLVVARDSGQPAVTLWGSGTATREFLYAPDAAELVVRAAELYDRPEPMNLGSGTSVTVRQLADMIARLVGYDGLLEWDTSKPDGQPLRQLDCARAAQHLGAINPIGLEAGLLETLEWFEDNVYRREG